MAEKFKPLPRNFVLSKFNFKVPLSQEQKFGKIKSVKKTIPQKTKFSKLRIVTTTVITNKDKFRSSVVEDKTFGVHTPVGNRSVKPFKSENLTDKSALRLFNKLKKLARFN